MNIKVVMGHYTIYGDNLLQVKTVDRIINSTGLELTNHSSPVRIDINNFWQSRNNLTYDKFIDYYEVPDVFQPELLTENTK